MGVTHASEVSRLRFSTAAVVVDRKSGTHEYMATIHAVKPAMYQYVSSVQSRVDMVLGSHITCAGRGVEVMGAAVWARVCVSSQRGKKTPPRQHDSGGEPLRSMELPHDPVGAVDRGLAWEAGGAPGSRR